MKLGDFLNTTASKLGLQNDPTFVAFIQANPQLAQIEFDDKVAIPINTGLMSLEGAKNNTDVKKHYDALVLNAIDAKLNPLAETYGATTEFETERSTYKRMDILAAKIQAKIAEIEAKSASGEVTKDTEVKRLNGELTKLQNQLTALQTSKDAEIAKLKSDHEAAMRQSLIDFELSGKNYANDQLDATTNVTIARAILDKALATAGGVVVIKDGKLQLKNANAPELDLLDANNKPYTFTGFADKALADAKVLRVTTQANATQQQQRIVQPTIQPQQPQQKTIDTTNFAQVAQQAMQDMIAGSGGNAAQ